MRAQHVPLKEPQQEERDTDGRNTHFIRQTKYGTPEFENIRAAAASASSGSRADTGRICGEDRVVQTDPQQTGKGAADAKA